MSDPICALLIGDQGRTGALFRQAADQLFQDGISLLFAQDARDGAKLIDEETVDVILVDLSARGAGLDRFETIQALAPELPIIVMAEQEDLRLAVQAVNRGASDFLDRDRFSSHVLKCVLTEAAVQRAPRRSKSEKRSRSRAERCSTVGSETVLVVDDVEGVRDLIREVLEMHGYHVLVAGHGVEAMQVAERYHGPIHVLLTDVVMPKMGGPELADRFAPRRPEAKIIFMSGYSDEAIASHGVLQPGTSFIKKPFTSEILTRRIRQELDAASG